MLISLAYQACKPHSMKLVNQMVSYKDSATRMARCAPSLGADIGLHRIRKLNDEG